MNGEERTYEATANEAAQFSWTDSQGNVHHEDLQPGDRVVLPDACSALAFSRAFRQATNLGHRATDEHSTLRALNQACGGLTVDTVTGEVEGEPHPAPDPPPDTPADPASDGDPGEGSITSPETVEAPEAATAQEVQGHRRTGESDGRTLEEQYHDAEEPLDEAEVVQLAREGGEDPDRARERVLKNFASPELPHWDFGRNDNPVPTVAADPVDVFGGYYRLREVDVSLPSVGFPIELVRVYRSGPATWGPLGFGWDHSYNQYVRPLVSGHAAVWTGVLSEEVYRRREDGGFEPQVGVLRHLEHDPGGAGTPETYRLVDPGGRVRVFQRPIGWPLPDRLPLVVLEDGWGTRQTLDYDAEGRLKRVADGFGRELLFTYGGCGLLEGVQDHTGRAWEYVHDREAEHLVTVTLPPTDSAPAGEGPCYEYDRLESHPRLRHNMVRVADAEGRTVVYNEYGKEPGSDDFGRVVTQYFGSARADFSATRLQDVPRIGSAVNIAAFRVETVVDGDYRVRTFSFRGDLLDERYRLTRDASYRLFARAYRYDEQGNRTLEVEPNGLALHHVYDHANPDPRARGNLLRSFREAPPTAPVMGRRLVEMTYEAEYQQVRTIEDENGAETRLVYHYEENPGGGPGLIRVEHPEVTLPDGTTESIVEEVERDAAGRVIRKVSGEGSVEEYGYHGPGPADGLLASVTVDPAELGLTESYEYDARGNGTALVDALGHTTSFEFDALGRPTRVSFPAAGGGPQENTYAYSPAGHLRLVRLPRGEFDDGVTVGNEVEHVYEHDALGRPTRQVLGANTGVPREQVFCYDAFDRVVRQTDPLGRVAEWTYDERGKLLTERWGDGAVTREWRYIYDRNGNRTLEIPPDDRRTEFEYDPWDRPRTRRSPEVDGHATEVRYEYGPGDVLERMETIGRPAPALPPASLFVTEIRYDELRRPLTAEREGRSASLFWDRDGRLRAQEDLAGRRLVYGYDGAGRMSSLTDAAGNETRYAHDAVGNVTRIERREVEVGGPKVSASEMAYDARRHLVGYSDPLGNSVVQRFDARGLLVEITDPLSGSIRLGYGLEGELNRRQGVVGGAPVTLEWRTDAVGRTVAYVDPEGAVTSYSYDAFDDMTERIYPDGSSHVWTRSPTGDLESETSPGGTELHYTWDGRGDLTEVTFVPGSGVAATAPITYERDGLGRAVRLSQGSLSLEREYDGTGRLTAEVVGGSRTEMAYDDAGAQRRLTYPDGRVDRTRLDVLNRPERIVLEAPGALGLPAGLAAGDRLAEYTYAGYQRPARRSTAAGVDTSWAYDAANRVTAVRHSRAADGTTLVGVRYLYDALGRRRLHAAGPSPLRGAWADFDELSRLVRHHEGLLLPDLSVPSTQADMDAAVASLGVNPAAEVEREYESDRADTRRRFRETTPAGVLDVAYGTNPLHQITGATRTEPDGTVHADAYVFDGDGRRLADSRLRYRYDALGRLVEAVEKASGITVLAQEFDPLGRLHRRTTGGATRRYLHFDDQVIQEDDGVGGGVVQRTPDLFGVAVLLESGADETWSLLDERFTRLAVCDGTGTVLERYRYAPFGSATAWAPDGTTPRAPASMVSEPLFAGHRPVVGDLYHCRERVYDPALGQFLQRDPEGYLDSSCLYAYAGLDPLDNLDVQGRWLESVWDAASLGLGIYSAYNDAQEGKWGWFALDCVGIVLDTAALILPVVPGGVGVAIKAYRAGNAAVDAGSNLWRTGRIVTGTGDDAIRTGRTAYRAERIVRGGQAVDQTLGVGQGFHQAGSDFYEGNYTGGMLNLAVAGVGARGGMAKWYDMPSRPVRPLNARERPFYPAAARFPTYANMPRRAFGNTWEMLRNPRVQYRARNLFSDDRAFRNVSRQYWGRNVSRRADGMQLQHTWVMNSTEWVPQRFRNAGLNLIEVPGRLNTWMGDNALRNGMFRLQVLSYAGVSGTASYQTGQELVDSFLGPEPRASQAK